MIWPNRQSQIDFLKAGLLHYNANIRKLPGISKPAALETLALQMVSSLRRLEYTQIQMSRTIDAARLDPRNPLFDPERAAMLHARNGNVDEACWLVFLATHFGKHGRWGWKRLTDFYSGLNSQTWTWQRAVQNVNVLRQWLDANAHSIGGRFGNHRKYESLKGTTANGTGAAIASYINWIGTASSHAQKFANIVAVTGSNAPGILFDAFYKDAKIARFGRLAKFDFLALLGRLHLAPIEPGSAYLVGSTGPLSGARLLYGLPTHSARNLDPLLIELNQSLGIGMQAMEDSLCNWQKSPEHFVHFKG